MRSYVRQFFVSAEGVAFCFVLLGCTGVVHVPLTPYSHIRFEAAPMDEQVTISYHRYEVVESTVYEPSWRTELKMDALGTLYDSREPYSPAARKLELGWEKLWLEGTPTWSTLVRLLNDAELTDAYLESDRAEPTMIRLPSEFADDRDPAFRDGHLFMFASPHQ